MRCSITASCPCRRRGERRAVLADGRQPRQRRQRHHRRRREPSAQRANRRRVTFGPVVGNLYRPFLGVQMAYFSSRGPNADGRPDPDVVSNGFDNFGQGYGSDRGSISLGSGTSFATPSVAGVAAVLRQRFPSATARTIRNAIIASANREPAQRRFHSARSGPRIRQRRRGRGDDSRRYGAGPARPRRLQLVSEGERRDEHRPQRARRIGQRAQ